MEQRGLHEHQQVLELLKEGNEGWTQDKLKTRNNKAREETSSLQKIESRSNGEKRELIDNVKKSRKCRKLKHEIIGENWGRKQPLLKNRAG